MQNSNFNIFLQFLYINCSYKELSGEDLDERKRELRDQLLEPLQEHLHDVNSFVRSKTLQLWHKLSQKQAIPLKLQHKVLSLAADRLVDKSSTVRKHAIQLLIVLMQGNPYASRLQLGELESQLNAEEAKLAEMLQLRDKDRPERIRIDPAKCGPTKTELWNAMEPEFLVAIHEVFEEQEDDNSFSMSELTDEQVVSLLGDGNYKRIVRGCMTDEDDPVEILHKVKKIYIGEEDESGGEQNMEELIRQTVEQGSSEQEQPPTEEESREITQQRTFVLYLKDSHAFANSVHGAIPVVCQLLCSKHLSDVLEAIDFFVTAFEFDVLDAMVGIRRMLSLVWSSESGVKDAVVNAYKRLYIDMEAVGTSKKRALQVVSNLTALISCSTQGELASLEELIALCVKNGDFPKLCIQVNDHLDN